MLNVECGWVGPIKHHGWAWVLGWVGWVGSGWCLVWLVSVLMTCTLVGRCNLKIEAAGEGHRAQLAWYSACKAAQWRRDRHDGPP
jgi:hypothetical protein